MAVRLGTPEARACPQCQEAGQTSMVVRRGWREVFLTDTAISGAGELWRKPRPPRVLVDYACSEGHAWEEVADRIVNGEPGE